MTGIRYFDSSPESPLLMLSASPWRHAQISSFVFFVLLSFPAELKRVIISIGIIIVFVITIAEVETVVIVNPSGAAAAAACSQQRRQENHDKFSPHVILLRLFDAGNNTRISWNCIEVNHCMASIPGRCGGST